MRLGTAPGIHHDPVNRAVMAKLFIANCTTQRRQFHYRLPRRAGSQPSMQMYVLELDPFKQAPLQHDLDMADLKAIIEPYEIYGFAPVSSITREKQFTGVAYSFDKEVPQDLIHYTVERNGGVMDELAVEDRMRNAAALDQNPDAIRAGLHPGTVEMTVEETPDPKNPNKVLKAEVMTTKQRRTG